MLHTVPNVGAAIGLPSQLKPSTKPCGLKRQFFRFQVFLSPSVCALHFQVRRLLFAAGSSVAQITGEPHGALEYPVLSVW
jgi:hypothetical protein